MTIKKKDASTVSQLSCIILSIILPELHRAYLLHTFTGFISMILVVLPHLYLNLLIFMSLSKKLKLSIQKNKQIIRLIFICHLLNNNHCTVFQSSHLERNVIGLYFSI